MIILGAQDGYRLNIERRGFFLDRSTTLTCPACGSNLHRFGRRHRVFVGASGKRYCTTIQRLRCTICQKIHHVLPEGILPYKRYRGDCVETAVTDPQSCVGADASTLFRWKHWLHALIPLLESALISLTKAEQDTFKLKIPIRPIDKQIKGWLIRAVKYVVRLTWRWSNPIRLEKASLY